MKCVGIIGAMEQEVARLKEVMENLKECMNFLVGRLSLVKNLKML